MPLCRARRMNFGSRKYAIKQYHLFRRDIDLATICFESGDTSLGEEFTEGAKFNLEKFKQTVEKDLFMETYAIEIHERWRQMVKRDSQVSLRIAKNIAENARRAARKTPLY